MDAAPWPQGLQEMKMQTKPPMEAIASNNNNTCTRPIIERKERPQEQLNCPRCNSTNTKFCYYNNYSLNQPRYLCKTCRRYWTEGGSLRNIPVGGGSRKNKRSSSSSLAHLSSSSSHHHHLQVQNPSRSYEGQDLNLSFPAMQETQGTSHCCPYNYLYRESGYNRTLGLLKTGIASRGLNSFTPKPILDSNTHTLLSSSGFPMQGFKPSLSFSVDVQENGGGGGGRVLFPFGELKQLSTTHETDHQDKGQGTSTPSSGFWLGMLGGGSW